MRPSALRRWRHRRWRLAASALLLVLTVSAATCTLDRQLQAGATACAPMCNTEGTAACIAYNAGSSACTYANASTVMAGCPLTASGDCLYQCLPWVESPRNDEFTFYVTPTASTNASDWSLSKLRQNAQFVGSVGAMAMPDRIKYVVDSVDAAAVASVRVALSLSGVNVTYLTLANLNMTPDQQPFVRVHQKPPRLESLTIVDSLLTAVPVETSKLTALKTLDLSRNAIATFPKNYSMVSLQHLNLKRNVLEAFEASFPALQSLDLSHNKLTAFPDTIFLFSNLSTLDISGNILASSKLSPDRYKFLSTLASLSIDGFLDDGTACQEENKKLLKALVVCVEDTGADSDTSDGNDVVAVKRSSLVIYILIPVLLTVAVALVVFSVWYKHRKKQSQRLNDKLDPAIKTPQERTLNGERDQTLNNFAPLHSSQGSKDGHVRSLATPMAGSLWTDEELLSHQLRYEDIEDVKPIGAGAFGVVWLVNYRQTRQLASKRLIKDHVTRQKTLAFVAEIKLVATLDHPNIVQFVGVAWTVESDLQCLSEFMANGDLRIFLDSSKGEAEHAEWNPLKLQIAMDIAEALVYVHSFSPPLVHRDLKSKNVLLSDDMNAKLTDFGVSRFQSESATMTSGIGTGKWLAPEVIAGGSDYTHLCDIYSYGVLLSELDTHEMPYHELQKPDVAVLQMVMVGSLRPTFRDNCPLAIHELAAKCLAGEPRDRPSAMEVAFTLRTLAKSMSRETGGLV